MLPNDIQHVPVTFLIMHSSKLHFKGTCPKCNDKNTFFIDSVNVGNFPKAYSIFHFDQWRTFCFYPLSICNQYACANVSVQNDNITDDSTLNDYSDTNGELKENENLIINFDVQPLIPPQPL